MKNSQTKTANWLSAVACIALTTTSTKAAALMVDFGDGTLIEGEAGFVVQNRNIATHSTVLGDITVDSASEQGHFDRGASAGVNNNLYRDFLFTNNAADIVITLSGDGIASNTDYILTFYTFDSVENRDTTYTPINGTLGPSLNPTVGTTAPAALDDYSVTGTYTSSGAGELTFQLVGGRTVINGFELDVVVPVPEPSTTALFGLGGLALILRRRR